MIKILRTAPFFAPAFSYGGPVVHTLNISKIQASLGYDVRVFTTNILTNEVISKDLPSYEIMNGIKIHRFPIKYRLGQSHYFITPNILSNFMKYDFDIIHSHSFRSFQTDISTFFSKLRNKPFIFTAHGTLRDMTLLDLSIINKEKQAKRMKFYDSTYKKLFLKVVDRCIVHSNYEKLWTIKNGIHKKLLRVIPEGVNVGNFTNRVYKNNFIKKFNVKNEIILFVGRLIRNYRNIEHLIIAMKEIKKEIQNVKLWIIGHSFDKDYENELKNLVIQQNLKKYVNFVTFPTREDIIGAYQTAKVVVFPITNSDSFGMPIIEAGASKCPVISTNLGPAPELIENGKNGFLTNVDDIDQLKEAILKILTDNELQVKMGNIGYENVLKYFSWEVITKKINNLYNELL